MSNQQHPITPPPELIKQWREEWVSEPHDRSHQCTHVATQAARWGDEQRLKACCEWLREAKHHGLGYEVGAMLADRLRAARRPKPPSLAEGALMALEDGDIGPGASLTPVEVCIIRRALERLQELEQRLD